jgi:hypothetical protein
MSWRTSPLPPNWRSEIVPRIKARDPFCVMCLEHGRYTPTIDVDHIGDSHDHSDGNLRGL